MPVEDDKTEMPSAKKLRGNQVTPEIKFSRFGESSMMADDPRTGRAVDFGEESVRKQLFQDDSSESISADSVS